MKNAIRVLYLSQFLAMCLSRIAFNGHYLVVKWPMKAKQSFALLQIERSRVHLLEIIGEGQFGDVHKGVYDGTDGGSGGESGNFVAVKTCKVEGDDRNRMTEKFLEEACKCSTFSFKLNIFQ